jgi:hypothetical protein
MVKRKCGTCKYFQDQGLASSGWCRHPERCDIQDMVLVRKAELACRNGWDRDLWEPAAASDAPARMDDVSPLQIPNPTLPPQRPAGQRRIPALLPPAPKSSDSGELYTDKITSIRMSSSARPATPDDAESPTRLEAAQRPQDGLTPEESRLAVREARKRREEARKAETRQVKETIVRAAGDLLDGGTPDTPPTQPTQITPGRVLNRTPSAPSGSAGAAPAPAEDTGKRMPKRDDRREIPHPSVTFPAISPRFGAPVPPAATPLAAASPRENDDHSVTLPAAMRRNSEKGIQKTEPLPNLGLNQLPESNPALMRTRESAAPAAPAHQSRGVGRPGSTPSMPGDSGTSARVHASDRSRLSVASIGNAPAAMPLAHRKDPIDVIPFVSAATRCCETCRDFKRVGDGATGWCVNPYAFAERRMVRAQELACRSSIGVWWLPHDDLWLECADITHHGRPTPNLDEELRAGHVSHHGMGPRSS